MAVSKSYSDLWARESRDACDAAWRELVGNESLPRLAPRHMNVIVHCAQAHGALNGVGDYTNADRAAKAVNESLIWMKRAWFIAAISVGWPEL